jgi:hypothetical protein
VAVLGGGAVSYERGTPVARRAGWLGVSARGQDEQAGSFRFQLGFSRVAGFSGAVAWSGVAWQCHEQGALRALQRRVAK